MSDTTEIVNESPFESAERRHREAVDRYSASKKGLAQRARQAERQRLRYWAQKGMDPPDLPGTRQIRIANSPMEGEWYDESPLEGVWYEDDPRLGRR